MLGILFVIFDLEIVFLIPLCVSLKMFGIIGFVWALKFLFILIAGLAFELYKGALDW